MRKIFYAFLCFITFCSCENDSEIVGGTKQDSFFKVTHFDIEQGSLDLNNDNIINSNMKLEFLNYFNETYDLQIKKLNDNSSLISFYIPKQNISFNYVCCPTGYVEFSKNGFTINMEQNQSTIENLVIDSNTRIISFSKLNNTSYKLILEKKYYDFNISIESSNIYEIQYEIIN